MTTPPEPVPGEYDEVVKIFKIIMWVLIVAAIFALCLAAIVFLGPLVLFAWISDRMMDDFEKQAPDFWFIDWIRAQIKV